MKSSELVQTSFCCLFAFQDAVESQRMARGQKEHLDREVRKFRRRRLIKYHELEQDLLREVKINVFNFFCYLTYIYHSFSNRLSSQYQDLMQSEHITDLAIILWHFFIQKNSSD